MSFDLLSTPIKRYIRDKRWEQLRPIQNAAITRILATPDNYILASRTASGKTEAAFLPILSSVDFNRPGVQVLYISPLIALINDQFNRVEELCKYLDVTVTKWHGEANKTAKEKLVKEPGGITLITPESLEAMLVNKPFYIPHLFSNLQFVVIDEIHAFIGSDRGIQLKSILSRIQCIIGRRFRVIGLSATIGDYGEAKRFTGDEQGTKVLLDKTAKEVEAVFRYFGNGKQELSHELLEDLYEQTKDNKVLLFPNSRGRTEEVAVKLKRIAEMRKGHGNYFSHHSSVDKDVREYVEFFAKNNVRQNFCISCTSTLELGIDIGTVDEVVQIDATHSISSLIQRVGRSGRKEGAKSNLFLYATNPWSLVQSVACWTLFKDGFIEPPVVKQKPFDILLHQALSIVKGSSGIHIRDLVSMLKANSAFMQIDETEIQEVVDHLIEIDLLEKLQQEVIIGVTGEKIVNSRNFYSVFKTEESYKVINGGNTIGEIPFSPQVKEGENLLLAARIWKIKYVDFDTKKIEVVKVVDGKSPIFGGEGGTVHPRIRERMLELIFDDAELDIIDEKGMLALQELRQDFRSFSITNILVDRPFKVKESGIEFYTFTGTRINKSLHFLFGLSGIKSQLDDKCSILHIDSPEVAFIKALNYMEQKFDELNLLVEEYIHANPVLMNFSKWGEYLPVRFQVQLLNQQYFDFDSARLFIKSLCLIKGKESSI